MTVQLIYAPTDSHIWAESYDRGLNQAYSLPEELSQTIAKEVKVATSTAPAQRYISPEAHDAYLHGRYSWFTFNVSNTLPYFEKAIQLQPDYAAAWSGLADTYAVDGMENRPPSEVSEKTHAAGLKALELDPSLAEAHNSLAAWYLFYAWDPARAEAEARRCVELDPNYAEGHHLFSYILEVQHRYAEAQAEASRSVELDPFMHPWELGTFYINTHQYDKALKELSMQTAARPDDPDIAFALSKLYWLKGMYKESQERYERALDLQHDTQTKAAAHKAWLAGGETAVERWGAKNIKALAGKQYFETEFVASIIAFTGDKDETMKYLEASYRMHDPDLIFIQNEPLFDFVHSDRRYQALVGKLGLTPSY
jgi:tetratricopeptide (TPR) repeat protein